jgi:acyl carrier protein
MKNFVIETISELLDIKVSEISLTSSFEDLEIDYLDLAELIMILEDKFGIMLDDSILDTKTVGELIEQLIKQVNNKK